MIDRLENMYALFVKFFAIQLTRIDRKVKESWQAIEHVCWWFSVVKNFLYSSKA